MILHLHAGMYRVCSHKNNKHNTTQHTKKTNNRCLHLSTFASSVREIQPSVKVIGVKELRDFNTSNISDHPEALVIVIVIYGFFFGIVLCATCRPKDFDLNILSTPMVWKISEREQIKQLWFQSIHKQMLTIIRTQNSYCARYISIVIVRLKNENPIFSTFSRNTGTNYTTKQRMFVHLVGIMVSQKKHYILVSCFLFFLKQKQKTKKYSQF